MPILKILIVDDEEPIRELLLDHFSQSHHECKGAESGGKALAMIPNFDPNIVITDFNMPKMNGIELLKQIREQNSKTNVIILTGFPDQQNAIDAVNFGARAFLQKPINLNDISAVVEKRLTAPAPKSPMFPRKTQRRSSTVQSVARIAVLSFARNTQS